jgi:hypothetical protein
VSEDKVRMPDDPSAMLEGKLTDATSSPVEEDREVTCRVWDANDFDKPMT